MRLGYIVAPAPLAEKIEMLKQVNDVHTPMLTQLMCVEFMKKYDIDKYIAKNRELYGKKCAKMVEAMEKYFPQGKVKWVVPEGGPPERHYDPCHLSVLPRGRAPAG